MKKIRTITTKLMLLLFLVTAPYVRGQATKPELPKAKQTSLELYVTASQAYEKWEAEPAKVKILDVRTPEEFLFVGHAPMAWNIPRVLSSNGTGASPSVKSQGVRSRFVLGTEDSSSSLSIWIIRRGLSIPTTFPCGTRIRLSVRELRNSRSTFE